ncbi:MAG: hypothetical protein H6673_11605 [Anaerolineales bacterium]|nr:hypothetical protein [Anaerolineales bacterium]
MDSLNEMFPWGLTGAQTSILCLGGFLILGGWVMLRNMASAAKSACMMVLALVMACVFLATVAFYLTNAS